MGLSQSVYSQRLSPLSFVLILQVTMTTTLYLLPSISLLAVNPTLARTITLALAFRDGDRWAKRGTCLGKNKKVFDAEVFAILQAARLLNDRGERGQVYTAFSDSRAAIARIQHDRTGPAHALAKVAIVVIDDLTSRDNVFTIRWTPAHKEDGGNEQADVTARESAEGKRERAEPTYLMEASLSHLTRKTTEARWSATAE